MDPRNDPSLSPRGQGDGNGASDSQDGTVRRGIGASPGVAAGPALVYRPAAPSRSAGQDAASDGAPAEERERLRGALAASAAELRALAGRVEREVGREEAGIFEAQALMLEDPTITERADALIGAGARAEVAVERAADEQAAELVALPDPVWQARAADVRDAASRVIRRLSPEAVGLPLHELVALAAAPVVVVAEDLTPSDTALLRADRVLGIALARGAATAHAAILARALSIPAVVGLGTELLEAVAEGDPVIVDGTRGLISLHPTQPELERAAAEARADAGARAARAQRLAGPGRTRDGHPVRVLANVGSPAAAQAAAEAGAEGIGLLRTEFLFAGRDTLPDEFEQADLYADIVGALGAPIGPVIIRTLDAGADKPLPALSNLTRSLPAEANPALGVRGIRLQLAGPDLLATQLRGIVRAAARTGVEVRAMLPMVSTVEELREGRAALHAARQKLAAQGVEAARPIPLGIMVETPAAVFAIDALAHEAAFFSIGTNDLTQYVMAADRLNPHLAELCQPLQPAVLRALAAIAGQAARLGRHAGVCGEMAGDPQQALLLVGLGIGELSMEPASIPAVKEALAAYTLDELRSVAARAVAATTLAEVRQLVAASFPAAA